MAMMICPECTHEISTKAKRCVSCGAKNPRYIGLRDYIFLVVAVVGLWYIVPDLYNMLSTKFRTGLFPDELAKKELKESMPPETHDYCMRVSKVLGGNLVSENDCLKAESEAKNHVEKISVPEKVMKYCKKVSPDSYSTLEACIEEEMKSKSNLGM